MTTIKKKLEGKVFFGSERAYVYLPNKNGVIRMFKLLVVGNFRVYEGEIIIFDLVEHEGEIFAKFG